MLFTVCVKSVHTLQRPNEKKVNVDLFLKKSDSKECKTNLECRKIKCEAIRSRKITAFTLPLSILKAQLSVASGKAVVVE